MTNIRYAWKSQTILLQSGCLRLVISTEISNTTDQGNGSKCVVLQPKVQASHIYTFSPRERERERSLPSDGWQMLPSEVNIKKWHPPHVLDVMKSHSIASHLQNWQDRAPTSGGLKGKYQTQAIQSTNLGNIKKTPN